MKNHALLLFSGGQDSATCLAHALASYTHVETLGFDYGQRHAIELECRKETRQHIGALDSEWQKKLGNDTILTMPALAQIGGSALIEETEIKMHENNLPTSFVAGRNLLFLTYAAALAYRSGAEILVGGMCETDYSGYPDCRRETLDAQLQAINLGMQSDFTLDTPLMHLTKSQTWQLAHQLGGGALTDIICQHTHTCYLGERGTRHEWGYGCGTCPACDLRAKGHKEWQTK